jgi:protein-arginine kinase activator protein McsA
MAHAYPSCPLPRPNGASAPKGGQVTIHRSGYIEGGHQLEKLEFALAVAVSRGNTSRATQLRDQIAALGVEGEEPGT